MKKVSIFIALAIAMCALNQANGQSNAPQMQQQQKQEFQNFYFSETHYEWILKMRESWNGMMPVSGIKPHRPTITTINGKYFTCQCDSVYFETDYKIRFPDAILVARLPKGEGKITVHY